MICRPLCLLSAAALLLGAATLATAGPPVAQPQSPAPALEVPGTGPLVKSMIAWFDKHDRNKDGFLDKEELAKAFRGPRAKVFDDSPKLTNTTTTRTVSATAAKKQPAYLNYADYQFLKQVDTNGDGRVSREEFQPWARNFAGQLKQSADVQTLQMMQQYQQAAQYQQQMGAMSQLMASFRPSGGGCCCHRR